MSLGKSQVLLTRAKADRRLLLEILSLGKLLKKPRAKPDGTKMFCSAFLNDARMCCFFANAIVKY